MITALSSVHAFHCRAALLASCLLFSFTPAGAQLARGTVQGRVFNPGNNEYLEPARIIIDVTSLETFTDSAGLYRLSNVPVGLARLRVFHTAIVPQIQSVNVTAGQTAQQDFNLASFRGTRSADAPVRLSEFVVLTGQDMDGAAIGINPQRFAPNVMTVVAADEFGTLADGNMGELLKVLPGLTAEYNSGTSPDWHQRHAFRNLPVTVNGFSLARVRSHSTQWSALPP
jgi:iron complex outermembrane recepter protein